jgi:putative NIF3 family GTP cyclohydrolase 1 type 2
VKRLNTIVEKLDELFEIDAYGPDTAFSRFLPSAYDSIGFRWQMFFEKDFVTHFNGLMIRGDEHVECVYFAVFPTNNVLETFIEQANRGDFLFMHHPLLMECGDPRGKWGRGFVPIEEKYLHVIKEKGLSVYTCHHPLDVNETISTSKSIVHALNGTITDHFCYEGEKPFGVICTIPETDTHTLIRDVEKLFAIPYVDFEGKKHERIDKIAIIAGCGDKTSWMKEAEAKGAQAYVTGEIHCHIDSDYGRQRYAQMDEYIKETSMSLIGVSHSASEYVVKKNEMNTWFQEMFHVRTILIPQEKWWL